jgi:flagellar hook assembly protein FlgD
MDDDGRSSISGDADRLLEPNFPNPFNPATLIVYSVPSPGPVRLSIYDITGRMVRTLVEGARPAGRHSIIWDGRNQYGRPAASGVYTYRLVANGRRESRQMVLAK